MTDTLTRLEKLIWLHLGWVISGLLLLWVIISFYKSYS